MAGSGLEKPIVVGTLEGIDVVLLPGDDLEILRLAAGELGLGQREAFLPLPAVVGYARSGSPDGLRRTAEELELLVRQLMAAMGKAGPEEADELLEEVSKALSGVRLLRSALALIDVEE